MVVGSAGTIYKFSNASGTVMASPTAANLTAVDMDAGGGGVAVGLGGAIITLGWTGAWASATNIRAGNLYAVKQNTPCLFYGDEVQV